MGFGGVREGETQRDRGRENERRGERERERQREQCIPDGFLIPAFGQILFPSLSSLPPLVKTLLRITAGPSSSAWTSCPDNNINQSDTSWKKGLDRKSVV